jgi:SSS family solute:Na+ symporter
LIDSISNIDNLVIILYFAVILAIGIIHKKSKEETAETYFLAGRNVGWLAAGVSLFATNISSEHLIGLAGTGSTRGLAVAQFEWLAVFILILLGWIFAPILIRSKVFSVPEFLGKRFDKRTRTYLAAISIVTYFITKIAVTLIAAGYLLQLVLGWDLFAATVMLVLLTGLYTVVGGLRSVIRTQIFQTVLLIAGSILLVAYGINEIGGFSALKQQLPSDYFQLFKPVSDPDFPWTGILFGAPILAIWYWCTDQYIVQRILACKGVNHARKGTALAAFLKIVPIFLFILPGMIAVVLYPNISGNEAYTFLLSGDLLPVGIKGIVISGLFAALMSSLASAFNSSATLLANDFYKVKNPDAKDQELVLVGRLATTLVVIITIFMIPLLRSITNDLYVYLQSLQAYISPPIASVFLFGVFWQKVTSEGAIWALISGGVLGLIRIILTFFDFSFITSIGIIRLYTEINYLYFAFLLFMVSSVVLIGVSLFGEKSEQKDLTVSRFVFHPDDLGFGWFATKIQKLKLHK